MEKPNIQELMSNYPETPDIETASDDYAGRFSGEVGDFFLDEQLRIALAILKRYENPKILDIGGGHGQLTIPLVELGYDVTVTGSDDCCEYRVKNTLHAQSYRYRTCNMLELPYEDESFDIVLAFRLIPHTENWQKLVAELSRVARKAVVIDYPDIRSTNILNAFLFRWKKTLEGNTRPFELFSRKQIGDEFNKHGCLVESYNPEFFLPMVLHRKIGSARFSRSFEMITNKLGLIRAFGSPIIVHLKKVAKN